MDGHSRTRSALDRLLRGTDDDRLRTTWRVAVPLALFIVVTYGSALFIVYPLLRGLDLPVITNIDLAILGFLGLGASVVALRIASRLEIRLALTVELGEDALELTVDEDLTVLESTRT